MGDQIRRAFQDWLAAECGHAPLVLVLDDIHWGDRPSIDLIAAALRHLRDSPFVVIAAGEPGILDAFAHLRGDRGAKEIRVGELPRDDAAEWAQRALGAGVEVNRIVDRARGDALHLDELVRAAARRDALPASAAEAIRASIDALPAEAQRVLGAAGVFGGVFWEGGLTAILDRGATLTRLDDWLAGRRWLTDLADRGFFTRRARRPSPRQFEYAFRHPLVREIAYERLDPEERALLHRRAGEWLERHGEREPGALARHFELGGEAARAAGSCGHAAELSLEGSDFPGVLAWVERGVALGATGELLGTLHLLEAEAHRARGEHVRAQQAALAASRLLPRGSAHWCTAIGQVALVSGNLGDHARLAEVFRDLHETGNDDPSGPHVVALARVALQALQTGQHALADQAFADLDRVDPDVLTRDPEVAASIHRARAFRGRYAGDPAVSLVEFSAAARAFDEVGDALNACVNRVNVGWVNLELGDDPEAERALRDALTTAERMGLYGLGAFARHNLGLALARQGHTDEARRVEIDALEAYRALGDRRLEGGCRVYLATILAIDGDLAEAEAQAQEAVAIVTAHPPLRAYALATLAQIWLLAGRADAALPPAEEAMRLLEDLGGIDEGEALVRLVHAVALGQSGHPHPARAAIRAARDRLLERAGRITSEAHRASFLARVPEHARTLTLARQWLGGAPPRTTP